jgi:hypothetical protein
VRARRHVTRPWYRSLSALRDSNGLSCEISSRVPKLATVIPCMTKVMALDQPWCVSCSVTRRRISRRDAAMTDLARKA